MTLFHPHRERDALAYAAAGGQALQLVAITPARLYDRDLPRLVATVHKLGLRAVHVARTGTARQHVVINGLPLIKACMQAQEHLPAAVLVDVLMAVADGGVAACPPPRRAIA